MQDYDSILLATKSATETTQRLRDRVNAKRRDRPTAPTEPNTPINRSVDEPQACDVTELESVGNFGMLDLVEMILKQPVRLERVIRDPYLQSTLIPKFLAISIVGFTFFGVAMSLLLSCAVVWPELSPIGDYLTGESRELVAFGDATSTYGILGSWLNGDAFKLVLAYAIGLIAATGICLPSLYFYGLLSGIRMTMLDVVVHALKSKATAAIALIGILPIYISLAMGMVIFGLPTELVNATWMLGLVLPFIAGLWGTCSLYRGFCGLTDTMADESRCRRECFLRRLVASWSVCYTAVSPVMIFTLWQRLG